ncbi:hypothetical protein KFK09_002661 [Dendrobium nobile]|uniref:Uncharacterized protein n=1 Tax=Dendrobium nobile TaxID=94219 RepID=A0A8T3C5I9_DENNO|nr:hypothetical protein KFK09_002661 [Dendrobium nobile]
MEKVDEALEVISIDLNIAPIACEAISESERVPEGKKKCDSLEGDPLTLIMEIGELKCPLGLLPISEEEIMSPKNRPRLYLGTCYANSTESSILPPGENDADIGTKI